MSAKIKICSVVNELGIGGTARQVVTMAKYLNPDFFEHVVVSVGSSDDVRVKNLSDKTIFFAKNADEAAGFVRSTGVDVVYVQRHGRNEPLHDALAEKLPKEVLLLELNTFSVFDKGEFGKRCDVHVFVSATNILKYLKQNDLPFDFEKQKVVYGLIDSENFKNNLPTAEEVASFKKKYQLENHFIIGRLARAVLGKWDDRTLIFWKRLCKLNPNIKFVIYGVPEEKKLKLAESGLASNLVILDQTSSDKELALFYSAIDALVHLSPIGECNCGAIAEAMLFGKPIVVTSTPFPSRAWRSHTRDNGQLEQIKNGLNGFVVNNGKAMAEAVNFLSQNPETCKKMGAANQAEIREKYDVKIGIKTLEKIFLAGLQKKGKALSPELAVYAENLRFYPDENFIQNWFAEYDVRLGDVFGKNSYSLWDSLYYLYLILQRKVNSLFLILRKI